MLAKDTFWGTALGRRAGENGVKRTAGGRNERRLLNLHRWSYPCSCFPEGFELGESGFR